MKGFTDIHQHLIFGIDNDGPITIEDTYNMIVANKQEGIGSVFATPHITPGIIPFSMNEYLAKVEKAREFCWRHSITMNIYTGGEILYTDMTPNYLQEGKIPTMAGTSFVLVEFPVDVQYNKIVSALKKLNSYGYIPILAHIERYRSLTIYPFRALKLREQCDVRYQVNCSTIINKTGFRLKYFLKVLFDHEMVDAVASDAHNTKSRPVIMEKVYDALRRRYGRSCAARLIGYNGNFITKVLNLSCVSTNYYSK